jgi:transglutaminase-like putative cysteine protease
MLPGARWRDVWIPEGVPGRIMTLERMRALIRAPDPLVDAVVAAFLDNPAYGDLEPHALAAALYRWVQDRMLYTPDPQDGELIDEIKTPGYLLEEIFRYGHTLGDCDDYVVLLGALYWRLGYRVTLVGITREADGVPDHVYLTVETPEGVVAADAIPVHGLSQPFGWEIPAAEVTNRVEVAV